MSENISCVHLVIGAGGLLGRSVLRQLRASHSATLTVSGLNWANDEAVRDGFRRGAQNLMAKSKADRWVIHWCAGIATVRSNSEESAREQLLLQLLLEQLESCVPEEQMSRGSLIFASSAGGVYSHSLHPPFVESSVPRPGSAYGRAKLKCEQMLTDWCETKDMRLVIGRISSIYGTNQNLMKSQGLLSSVVRCVLMHEPLTLFVPLSATRNYIDADDAARLLLAHFDRNSPGISTFNICSPTNVSIAEILHTAESMFRRRIPVRQSIPAMVNSETRDLRISSIWRNCVETHSRTSLRVGLHKILLEQLAAFAGAQSRTRRGAVVSA